MILQLNPTILIKDKNGVEIEAFFVESIVDQRYFYGSCINGPTAYRGIGEFTQINLNSVKEINHNLDNYYKRFGLPNKISSILDEYEGTDKIECLIERIK